MYSGYVGDPDPTTRCRLEPCSTDPCGIDAECESRGRQAVCKCPRGYQGDPYTRCSPDPCGEDPCGEIMRDMYRVVQLNLTPEIEVFFMQFDRCLSIFSATSLKQHT